MKDVLKCITITSGEQFVIIISLTQLQQLFVALSDFCMYRLATVNILRKLWIMFLCCI